jgi:hypothetical protein
LSLWSSIWGQRANLWTSGKLQAPAGFKETPIISNEAYVSIYLKSMFIKDFRRGFNQYFGTVHSFISIPHLSGQTAEFHVVTTPTALRGITGKNLNKIIQLNIPLLGPIPYRGGNIAIEAGLFSIPYDNMADSFLKLLEKMSTTAGVSFVSSAIPFAGLVADGVDALTGSGGSNILEVGLKTTLNKPNTQYYVSMAAPKGTYEIKDLQIDPDDFSLKDTAGCPITKYAYMVFSIEADPNRETWFQIPELSKAYLPFKQAMEEGRATTAEENFVVFKRAVVNSSDLLLKDGIGIINKIQAEKDEKLSALQTKGQKIAMPSLEQISLY